MKRSIKDIATEVFDTGRRGLPLPGCDCEQCFGYCLIDRDMAHRVRCEQREVSLVEENI
jgi:hypothetical protein